MKVKMTLSIGLANAEQKDTLEFDDDDVKDLSPDELDKFLYEAWKDWIWEHIDGGPTVIEEAT